MAKLAQEKSDDAGVKNLAEMLEEDHSKALNKLKKVVQKPDLKIPDRPGTEAVQVANDLEQISDNKEFNEEWLEEIISMHESSIDLLEAHVDKAENQELKTWIDNALPTIRMHLNKAKALEKRIKG